MPELPEVESYRALAERALRRPIVQVDAPDAWFLKDGLDAPTVEAALTGRYFVAARRTGKLLLLHTAGGGPVLGLRFGMTGRLVVDGRAGVDRLLYSSDRDVAAWDRFAVSFADGGRLLVRDPRRLGGVLLDPDQSGLGPDALTVTPAGLRSALAGSTAPLKARLMDQSRLAGVGNLLADETLWRAGLDPRRPAGSLSPAELRRLHRHLRATVTQLVARGGSHTGDLRPARTAGGACPKDGAPLTRGTVGGRTTWWCPTHQR
ncbi:MAG: formamidopyrimidine-DNA glycosylase [Actinomycetota bacterium]|nr:formamidopyrimidine-DNA glycosylase [Actinomycetota bacterium]PLS75254.1 MAG: formamidopyrimidine-DNA glycosylase [Actinomycetota bacterium]